MLAIINGELRANVGAFGIGNEAKAIDGLIKTFGLEQEVHQSYEDHLNCVFYRGKMETLEALKGLANELRF